MKFSELRKLEFNSDQIFSYLASAYTTRRLASSVKFEFVDKN